MHALGEKFPDYGYKEAALNPTNPRDRALDWEADLIQHFRDVPSSRELTGELCQFSAGASRGRSIRTVSGSVRGSWTCPRAGRGTARDGGAVGAGDRVYST